MIPYQGVEGAFWLQGLTLLLIHAALCTINTPVVNCTKRVLLERMPLHRLFKSVLEHIALLVYILDSLKNNSDDFGQT